ncbi:MULTISPECIES: flagellar biosynthetic protein FliO [unclassified Nitrospina]|uniref:flagellar biosynthetic protein FliO n=1 Tax=unclassified Nitrospina TaxID=2638683 RepID=UPI003F94D433
MEWKRFGLAWALVLNFLVSGAAWALPLTEYNKLRDVRVQETEEGLHIQLQFRHPPDNFQAPVFFQNSVQVDLPFAYLAPAKQYFPTGDDEIRQVYASQYNKELLRIRFIIGDRRQGLEKRFRISRNGNNIDVLVRNGGSASKKSRLVPSPKSADDPLSDFLASGPSHIEVPKTGPQSISSGTENESGSQSPDPFVELLDESKTQPAKQKVTSTSTAKKETLSEMVGTAFRKDKKGKGTTESRGIPEKETSTVLQKEETSGGPDIFSAGLKMFYTLALVLGLMFLLFHVFKKYVWKNGVFGTENKPIKVLSTGFLGPKKSIALVEVAGEVLVLGIANENISLLANVEDPDQIDRIKGGSYVPTSSRIRKKEATSVQAPTVAGTAMKEEDPVMEEEESAPEITTATDEPPKPSVPPHKRVDAYERVVKQPKTTNPFPDFVKQFADDQSKNDGADSVKGLEQRLKKTLEGNRGK